jgi:phosphatidylglycerophosphate synthase
MLNRCFLFTSRLLELIDKYRNGYFTKAIDNRFVLYLVSHRIMTPNGLTLLRLYLFAGIIGYLNFKLINSGTLQLTGWELLLMVTVFTVATITDALDGALARLYKEFFKKEELEFGVNFDRNADKAATIPMQITYLFQVSLAGQLVILATILGDVLAAFLAYKAKHSGCLITSNSFGKAKMAMQCAGLASLLVFYPSELFFLMLMSSSLTLGIISLYLNMTLYNQKHTEIMRCAINSASKSVLH